MALPFDFEESVFEGRCREGKGRGSASPSLGYSPRCCEPEWFCEETDWDDDAECVNIKKFRGDLAYKQREFKKALCEYSGCLVLLPPSNAAMRRDVQESQARCFAHLGRHKEALEIAETLRLGATNTDHITTVLGLQLAIYQTLERVEEIIGCLQPLILLHPFHPGNWKLLAEAYAKLLEFPAPLSLSEADLLQPDRLTAGNCLKASAEECRSQCCQKDSSRKGSSLQFSPWTNNSFGSCEERQTEKGHFGALGRTKALLHATKAAVPDSSGQEGSKDLWIYACASFIRARLLLQLMQSNQSSFALERNLKAQQEIEDKITSFGVKGDALFLMTEVMGEDLVPEKLKEDAQGEVKCLGASTLASMMTVTAVEFERKWFQKLRDQLPHLDCHT
ncbi:XP_028592043.1uncharacterized protein C8orf76 homolog isoform X2 [Podarcis lilfordi]|uniref:XP_028592043.1uncharacterized protein C8orf76 homolog isoform X2 n=1 Tax=Podarcis lilfordi TaxID=74358 RepID=A0AA35KK61_9SAUR|nr:XP_028592043.1uncharacterized protein C8orf76 homolog isoform X2 [Podarcis lilfordi]